MRRRGRDDHVAVQVVPITVPAGVSTGQYMHLRGVGNAGARGGPRGDLVVLFDVDDDERFERDGEDLYTEVLLTFPQAVRGADVEVAGIAGPITLHIPQGTQSGQVFQLRGRGLPRVNASGTGDLHVRVQVWTPTDLTADEKRVIDELAKVHSPAPTGRNKGFWAKMKEALGA
jgi:molecular chaperone DnaJ